MIKRRHFMQSTAATIGLSLLQPFPVTPVHAATVHQGGDVEIITLSDGNLRLPLSFIFPDVPQDEMRKLLAEDIVGDGFVEPALNLTLMKTPDRTVLFDVGSGPNFMPSAGKLAESLETAGVAPDDITDVAFTHGHPDHLWGILDDFDDVLFAGARLHFPRREFEFWSDPGTVDLMEDARKPFAIGARNRLEAMEEQLVLFDPGAEVVSGVEAMDTSGHTPGHTAFAVHAGTETFMVIGDALTNYRISFERPGWPSGSDHDRDKGIEARKSLLDRLAGDKVKFVGYHLPNDGVGYAERSGDAFRFVAA